MQPSTLTWRQVLLRTKAIRIGISMLMMLLLYAVVGPLQNAWNSGETTDENWARKNAIVDKSDTATPSPLTCGSNSVANYVNGQHLVYLFETPPSLVSSVTISTCNSSFNPSLSIRFYHGNSPLSPGRYESCAGGHMSTYGIQYSSKAYMIPFMYTGTVYKINLWDPNTNGTFHISISCTYDDTPQPTNYPSTSTPSSPTISTTPTMTPTRTVVMTCGSHVEGEIGPYGMSYHKFMIPTTSADSSVTISSCDSSFDTWLYVFEDNAQGNVWNCDDCGAMSVCGTKTVQEFGLDNADGLPELRKGTMYEIGVGGWSSHSGVFKLDIICHSSAITCGSNVIGDILAYQKSYRELMIPTTSTASSVTISTCGSSFDTWLYVENNTGGNVWNCDDCGASLCVQNHRTVQEFSLNGGNGLLQLRKGTVYKIGVGGYMSNYGAFKLTISCN